MNGPVDGTTAGGVASALRTERHDGCPVWVIRFAASGDTKAHDVRLDGLDPALAYAPTIRDAFVAVASRQGSITSRKTHWMAVKNGLLAFLAEAETDSFVFDAELMARFGHWLNARNTRRGRLSLRSRTNYFRKAIAMLRVGAGDHVAGLDASRFDWRVNPWSRQQLGPPSQNAFPQQEEMTAILRRCRDAVEAVMEELGDDMTALFDDLPGGKVVEEARRIRSMLHPHGAAPARDLPTIARGSRESSVRAAALRLLMPRISDLMPFIILMAHYTAFNSSTLLTLRVDGIRRRRSGQASWTIVENFKARADRTQRAEFAVDESTTNPDRLLRFVERWTYLPRAMSGSNSLWVARVKDGVKDLGAPETTLQIAGRVTTWLADNGLPHRSLSAIRKGMIDLAHLASGGDEAAVRAIGGQTSADVIDRHYTSDAARRRDRERLSGAVEEMERLLLSDGKVDARRLPDQSDRSAATPGFICADRYASPIPGEVPGRSCQAYGHCPICPLAIADVTSPRACGYMHLLFERIEEGLAGNDASSVAAYIATWLPVARRLRDQWLPAFDRDVREAAKQLSLISLPEID